MSGHAEAARRGGLRAWSPYSARVLLGMTVVATLCIGVAAAPGLFKGATLRSDIVEQVHASMGLTLKVDGAVRFELLPKPHVEMVDLHIADKSGALRIDAESLQGEVRFLPLLVGRLEIASAVLQRPHLVIDLDAGASAPEGKMGRPLHPSPVGSMPGQRLGALTLVDGSAVLKSRARARDMLFQAVNVTIDWRNFDAPATLTGGLTFEGVDTDVAAWVAQPSALLRGDPSALTLRLHSALLDLSAGGEFAGSPIARYRGRVSLTGPSLPQALAFAGIRLPAPAPFANLSLTSDATAGGGAFDLTNLRLRLDGNAFEGTLAYQLGDGGASFLSGTLATEQLSLAPFIVKAPPLLDRDRRWSRDRVAPLPQADDLRLDLRISATHIRLSPYRIDDAALAVMTRDGRTDIALVDGKIYGGGVKGHVSLGSAPEGFSVRVAGSITDADASALSWDLFGRQVAAGSVSLAANLETAGDSASTLVGGLRGWIKGRAVDGDISGLGTAVSDPTTGSGNALATALGKGRTPFDAAEMTLQIAGGQAAVEKGELRRADLLLKLSGMADVGQRRFDLTGVLGRPGGAGTPAFTIKGPFDRAVLAQDQAASPP